MAHFTLNKDYIDIAAQHYHHCNLTYGQPMVLRVTSNEVYGALLVNGGLEYQAKRGDRCIGIDAHGETKLERSFSITEDGWEHLDTLPSTRVKIEMPRTAPTDWWLDVV